MGSGIKWTCAECGKEIWLTYLGSSRENTDWTISSCEKGEYGKLAQYLISDDCPIEINVREHSEIYYCPDCSGLFERWTLFLWAEGDDHGFTANGMPEFCPNGCEKHLEGPYLGDDALRVIDEHEPTVCPRCGQEWTLRRNEYLT